MKTNRSSLKAPVVIAVLILATACQASAQQPAPSPEMQAAGVLFQANKFAEAVAAYEDIVKGQPENGVAWYQLGNSLYSIGETARAIEALHKADPLVAQIGLLQAGVRFRLGRAYAKLGNKDSAFDWLSKALQVGFPNYQLFSTDPDIALLRGDARYKRVHDQLLALVNPCNARPEYRQFDFWVGDWDLVLNPNGQPGGSSKIELTLNNCVIHETFTGGNGYVGHAFHYFNSSIGKWSQHYIDTVGTPFDWVGEFKDGKLLYERETTVNNAKVQQKMAFWKLEDGRVRQVFSQSADGGKTWQVGFDGTYVRKKAA